MPFTALTDGTRATVLHLLLERGRATVAELSDALGLTQNALRRHLERLRSDGLAALEIERREMGRPVHVYVPTEAAIAGHSQYDRLTERLVREVTVLRPEEVSGLSGDALLQTVFHNVARRVVDEHRPEIRGENIERRVEALTEALRDEGILSGWAPSNEGYLLFNATCPYRRVASVTGGACVMDREVIEELLGAPVDQLSRVIDGEVRCEYLVRKDSAQPDRTESEEVIATS